MVVSATVIWLFAFYLSMVHGNNIHDIYFMIQILA